jgi:hypothetical protein
VAWGVTRRRQGGRGEYDGKARFYRGSRVTRSAAQLLAFFYCCAAEALIFWVSLQQLFGFPKAGAASTPTTIFSLQRWQAWYSSYRCSPLPRAARPGCAASGHNTVARTRELVALEEEDERCTASEGVLLSSGEKQRPTGGRGRGGVDAKPESHPVGRQRDTCGGVRRLGGDDPDEQI